MSTIDSEDRNVTGYFLPEDTQLRLKQLREYVGFLTNLARPRRPDEDSECYNEIRPGEVAICFELIEEQIGLVLDELSWPAERGEPAEAPKAAADTETEAEAETEPADTEAEEPYVAEPATNATSIRYIAGVTLSQIDEMHLLLGSLHAYGNVVVCTDHAELSEATLTVMGDAIYRDVDALRDILREIDGPQRLEPPLVVKPGVREEEATYLALPTQMPMSSTSHVVREHPTYQ
ncbi:XAC0095 family protein [Dyella sp. KULCS107]|uniref:XAC0095 family protein n=1 Tax=Dyella sp. KULCS107 TaxID=3422216 RepID=UPI003D6DCEF9